ncbi:MAG: hypothetical protein ACP5DQ_00425 [Bacteroidales bacterium]
MSNNNVLLQNIKVRVFEPEKDVASKIYNTHSDIIINVLMRNKWIGKTSFDVKVLDFREENVKEFNKQNIHTEITPDKESLNSTKQALAESFTSTVKNAKIFV